MMRPSYSKVGCYCSWLVLLELLSVATTLTANNLPFGRPTCSNSIQDVFFLPKLSCRRAKPADHAKATLSEGPRASPLLGAGLCASVWYRGLLQGVCPPEAETMQFRARANVQEEEVAVKEKTEEVMTVVEQEGQMSITVEKEWTKNFASPECGAKLGKRLLYVRQ